jgi:chromosome segregation ATPase
LRISLTRVQSTQILLSRYPMQQGAVARASEHFDEARSKLAEIQVRQREVAGEVKRLEEAMSADENLQQQKAFEERINPVKSELEVTSDTEQQRQATEIQAEQQLRAEPDTLTTLETQLDDSIRSVGNAVEQSGRNRP